MRLETLHFHITHRPTFDLTDFFFSTIFVFTRDDACHEVSRSNWLFQLILYCDNRSGSKAIEIHFLSYNVYTRAELTFVLGSSFIEIAPGQSTVDNTAI